MKKGKTQTKVNSPRKMIIEIIEDDLSYLKLLNEQLSQKGFEIFEAKDGKEGLAIAKQKQPDLILLDIRMPVMNGLTMLHELRNESFGKKVDVIVLTNLDPNDDIIKHVIEDRPTYYFVKSDITFSELLTKIEELLF